MRNIVVSFVIPSYNSSEHVSDAILSIEKYCGCEYEVIVVDDCSEDVGCLEKLVSSFHNCILVKKSRKTNAADSRNIGYSVSKGEIVFFLDSDDRILEGYVDRRVHVHRDNKVGIVFGRFFLSFDEEEKVARDIPAYIGGDFRRYLFESGGDIRSSTISVCKEYFTGVLFDCKQKKHQDWGFGIRNGDAGERMLFDCGYGVLLDVRSTLPRMSSSSHVEASQYFCREYSLVGDFAFGFVRSQIFPLVRRGDIDAIYFFRLTLKENFQLMNLRNKLSTLLVLTASMPIFHRAVNWAYYLKRTYAK